MMSAAPSGGSALNTFEQAGAAFRQARYADAADLFRATMAADPAHADAGLWLSTALLKAGRVEEAAAALDTALQRPLDLSVLLTICQLLLDETQWQMAMAILAHIYRHAPQSVPAQLMLAEMRLLRGNADAAVGIYRAVLEKHPAHRDAVTRYLPLLSADEARKLLDVALRQPDVPPDDRLHFLAMRAANAERAGRLAHGKPDIAADAQDVTPRYAAQDLAAYRDEAAAIWDSKKLPSALEHKAIAEYALSAAEAAASFGQLRALNIPKIAGVVTLDPAFYEQMDNVPAARVADGLPPVDWIVRPAMVAQAYVLAADPVYMRDFGMPMIRSIAANAPGSRVHVHLMNATDEGAAAFASWAAARGGIQVSISRERVKLSPEPKLAALYYHAVRFVRLYQFLEDWRVPLTMMDVDGLMNGDFHHAVAALGDFDVALKAQAAIFAPWSSFTAGVVTVRPTAPALRYMKLVAATIADHAKDASLRWGADQLALKCCYDFLAARGAAPALVSLQDALVSRSADPAAPIWMQAGKKKRAALLSAADTQDERENAYVTALRKFTANES